MKKNPKINYEGGKKPPPPKRNNLNEKFCLQLTSQNLMNKVSCKMKMTRLRKHLINQSQSRGQIAMVLPQF